MSGRPFPRSGKSQADLIRLLIENGWTEDQSRDSERYGRTNIYLWRWIQPGTRARFTLKDAIAFIQGHANVTLVTKKSLQSKNSTRTISR